MRPSFCAAEVGGKRHAGERFVAEAVAGSEAASETKAMAGDETRIHASDGGRGFQCRVQSAIAASLPYESGYA
jgi:hypothetical protein